MPWEGDPIKWSDWTAPTDAEKLRLLAAWFDRYDKQHVTNCEVQADLRRIADYLDRNQP